MEPKFAPACFVPGKIGAKRSGVTQENDEPRLAGRARCLDEGAGTKQKQPPHLSESTTVLNLKSRS